MADQPRTVVGVRIKPEAVAQIKALADAAGCTPSAMVRHLLAEALDERARREATR